MFSSAFVNLLEGLRKNYMLNRFSQKYRGIGKGQYNTLDIAPLHSESPPQKRSGMARVLKGFHSFYLHTHTFIRNRNEPYLPLPSQL